MTADIAALDRLIEAVKAGDLTDVNKQLGAMFANDHSLAWDWVSNVNSAFRGSFDAFMALKEALLPDLLWEITPLGNCYIRDKSFSAISHAIYPGCPARAGLLALLRAHRARIGGAQ